MHITRGVMISIISLFNGGNLKLSFDFDCQVFVHLKRNASSLNGVDVHLIE